MAVETTIVSLPLTGGLNDAIEPRLLQPGAGLLQADNVVYDVQGALVKRAGFAWMSGTVVVPSGLVGLPSVQGLATRASELLAMASSADGSTRLLSYSPAASGWVDKDFITPFATKRTAIVRGAVSTRQAQATYAGGFIVYTWTYEGLAADGRSGLYYRVVDAVTGAVRINDTRIDDVTNSAYLYGFVVLVCTDVQVIYTNGADAKIATIALGTGAVTIRTLATGNGARPFDACAIDATRFFYTWADNANNLILLVVNISDLSTSATTSLAMGSAISNGPTCTYSGLRVYLGWSNVDTKIASWTLNAGLIAFTVGFAAVTVAAGIAGGRMGIGVDGLGICRLFFEFGLVTTDVHGVYHVAVNSSGVVQGAAPIILYHCNLESKPSLIGGRFVVMVTAFRGIFQSGFFQQALVMLQIAASTPARIYPVAVLARDEAADSYRVQMPAITNDGTFAYYAKDVVATPGTPGNLNNTQLLGVDLVSIEYSPPSTALWDRAEAQDCLHLSGGYTAVYDGETVVESGFVQPPVISAVALAAGTGLTSTDAVLATIYNYVACYEWWDSKGNLHRSEPSLPFKVSIPGGGASQSATLTIWCTQFTLRSDDSDVAPVGAARIALFRTLHNGGVYYRLQSQNANSGNTPPAIYNSATAANVTFLDSLVESTLLSNAYGLLYTEPQGAGPFSNVAPPGARAIVTHKNRLWLASAEDSRVVWYTKSLSKGEAPAWAAQNILRVDDSPDPITALASLDEALIVFTANRIYAITGYGPTDTGALNDFTPPQLIASDAGCTDTRSIAVIPAGVLFLSAAGIKLLTRSREVINIGLPVQTTLAKYGNGIVGTRVDRVKQRVYFATSFDDGTEAGYQRGAVLVYDYRHSAWTRFTLASTGGSSQLLVGCVTWQGACVLARNADVWREASGANPGFDASGLPFYATVKLPWLATQGIGGWQRARGVTVMGDALSPCTFNVRISNDYKNAFISQNPSALQRGTFIDLGYDVVRQEMTSLQVTISDSAQSLTADPITGFRLLAVNVEVGPRQGPRQLPAAQKG